jgi:hypothetical protein
MAGARRQYLIVGGLGPLVEQAGQGKQAARVVIDDENLRFVDFLHVGFDRLLARYCGKLASRPILQWVNCYAASVRRRIPDCDRGAQRMADPAVRIRA